MSLKDRVVLITGGRRVGSDLALMLADRGASVAMTYRTSRGAIEETLASVEARGVGALAIAADLSRAGDAESAVAATVERFGRIDALVNMASIYRETPFAELTAADFDEMIATNLATVYFTSVAAGRAMLEQPAREEGIKGQIVTVGDWATERPGRGVLPYITAKGALATFTMALAKELAPHVLVNLLQPSMIEPPPGTSDEEVARTAALHPLGRTGTPGDLNRMIAFLLEHNTFQTGTCLRIDGGRFLGQDSQGI